MREPIATYRVQLTPEFTFAEVAGVLDEIADLGVSHLYLSPILQAMPGSTHGYDWCAPPRISDVLGGADGYRLLHAHAHAVGLGVILDIVPNHMGVADARHNPWWADVLRRGGRSPYATYFDLDLAIADGRLALPWLAADGDLSGLGLDPLTCELTLPDGDHDDGTPRVRRLPTAPGTASADDDPRAVLDRQHYLLMPFDSRLIGYRRFLAVNELAALRQEVPEVYDATHAWLRDLIADDLVDGVRVDHLDGLTDPVGYCRRLRADLGDRILYVEKGIGVGERLDPALEVDGTTGYDALRVIEAAFTASSGAIELAETYQRVVGAPPEGDGYQSRIDDLRHVTLIDYFPDRVRRTTEALSAAAPHLRPYSLQQAVTTFVSQTRLSRPDFPVLTDAVHADLGRLRAAHPTMTEALDVLDRAFADREFAPAATTRLGEAVAATTAKAIEDIGFHRTARLVSTQELGCSPGVPSLTRDVFHDFNATRARHWPRALTALSTHDTKRGEDVRARIAVIAQTPQRWTVLVFALWKIQPPPHPRTGYLLLQNVIGVWPDDGHPGPALRERTAAYARKAMREGGIITSWTAVDEDAEDAMLAWLYALQTGPAALLIARFVASIRQAARDESLSRKALSLLLPGVGDVYQGTQWWEDSLTDPDNRRPVDYSRSTEHPKTALVRTALQVRRGHLAAFGPGSGYAGIIPRGDKAQHVIVFSRSAPGDDPEVVVAAVRLAHTFRPGPAREEAVVPLPSGLWRDAETGRDHVGPVTAARLLGDRPVVILERL